MVGTTIGTTVGCFSGGTDHDNTDNVVLVVVLPVAQLMVLLSPVCLLMALQPSVILAIHYPWHC